MQRTPVVLCALLAVVAGACDACSPKAPAPNAKPSIAAPVPRFGVIEGVVRLADGAELPEVPPRMMYQQFLQQEDPLPSPSACTPAKQSDRRPVQIGPGNVLSSIFLAASDFKTPVSRPPKVHDLTIDDCRLQPMVIGAMRGDTLRIRSTTDYPFMPQVGSAAFIETMIKGQERSQTLEALGVQTVLCAFTAPCGRADVITVAHPLYTLSDTVGRFRLEGVPAVETFNLNAWHPLFRTTTHSVKVAAGETKQLDFVMTPEHQYTPTGQDEARRRAEEAAKPVAPGTRPD
jgi:hypothetical protein